MSITSTDASEEAPMFARLLPMSMALRASSKCSVILTASPAFLEPSSRAFSRRSTLQEEYAISDAEQKFERHRHRKMPMEIRTIFTAPHRLPLLPEAGRL